MKFILNNKLESKQINNHFNLPAHIQAGEMRFALSDTAGMIDIVHQVKTSGSLVSGTPKVWGDAQIILYADGSTKLHGYTITGAVLILTQLPWNTTGSTPGTTYNISSGITGPGVWDGTGSYTVSFHANPPSNNLTTSKSWTITNNWGDSVTQSLSFTHSVLQ